MNNKRKKSLKVDEGAIKEKIRELASLLNYEYHDIQWLTEAMQCRIIKHGGGGRNRDNYTNGKYAILGDMVLIPAHDLYIEAIIGAIFKDRGYEHAKEWTLEFFNRNGYKIGIDQISVK